MSLFVPCAFSSTNNFAHAQTLYRISSLCRSYEFMNIAQVNNGVLTGWKKIKQRRISFVLGYLRILWKISTAISIKHQILATFNIKKKFNSDSQPLNTLYHFDYSDLHCCEKLWIWPKAVSDIEEFGEIKMNITWKKISVRNVLKCGFIDFVHLYSPQNENLNLLVRIKFLNLLYIYIYIKTE
jgi:hypothetical protein